MTRRTIRRYAHELYPYPDEGEIRPLSVEVPYLYARMVGRAVWGTGWSNAPTEEVGYRLAALTEAARTALLADALAQGMTGDEAWEWVTSYVTDDLECAYDRAVAHGVDPLAIKPYPCGPTPDHHWHRAKVGGLWSSVRVSGAEDDCEVCTEEEPVEDPPDETATEETA
jgi:hypothetical protein